MQGEGDRDRAIDRALRHTMGAPMNTPRGECIDADVLAAWSEGTLRSDRAAAVESHLSECARCQQMLAAFARSAPEPVAPEPLWRRWRLQWLVPIATAATAAAIWVASPRQDQTRASQPVSDHAAPPVPSQPPQSAERTEPAPEIRAPASETTPAPARPAPASPPAIPPAANEAPAQPAPLAPARTLQKQEELERRDAQSAAGVQSAPRGQAAQEADTRARANDAFSPQPEPAEARRSSPPAATASSAPAPAAEKAAAPTPAAAPAPPAPPPPARSGIRALGDSARFSAATDIVSPNAQIRWRIVNGRQVERTVNGGAQWEPATLPTAGALTAGASPSPSVCWIVGRGGAVYVTSDGVRFTRVMFPESTDLVSVAASDDRHATVMSADGRSFTTADQGMTWSAR